MHAGHVHARGPGHAPARAPLGLRRAPKYDTSIPFLDAIVYTRDMVVYTPLLKGAMNRARLARTEAAQARRLADWLRHPGRGTRSASVLRRMEAPRDRKTRTSAGLGPPAKEGCRVPYYTCPRCRLGYYSAASWAYVPECPSCYERLDRLGQSSGRVVSIFAVRRGKSTTPGAARDEPSSPGEHQ
jgi:hypothetical protein